MKSHVLTLPKFPSVDIVEASAGSGKTYALARRYLQLIMDPELRYEDNPLKSILAVTFTNKATIEMKERILDFLKKVALDASTGKEAKRRAQQIMDDILNHYNFFQVQTIDSFINTLLSGCSFRLGLASNFRIKEDHRTYLEYSLDTLIDKAQMDKNILKAFDEFLRYYLSIENRNNWLCKENIEQLIESLYNYSNTYGGMFKKSDITASQLWKKKQRILNFIQEIRDNIPEETDRRFIKSLEAFLEKNEVSFNIDGLSAYFEREKFPIRRDTKLPEKLTRIWNNLRKNIRELCELESHAMFNPYIEIFNMVLNEFRRLSGHEDLIFLQELNTHAQLLLDDKALTVDELYYRLATRLRHYLIDEFQDTSRLQWRNILPMIEEALSSGGSLFYVGDKKQAIYRFRGGDVSLFDSVQEDFKNYNPKQALLSKNYRSQRAIVEFNNEIFSSENLKRFIKDTEAQRKDSLKLSDDNIDKVLNVFRDSKQRHKEENRYGYVKIEAFQAETIDERDRLMRQKLSPLIKELNKRFSFGDIAILARENKDVKLFTSWLIEEGIPVESDKTLNIREHPLIKELISFLKFLSSPIDNLSFASFILGDIFLKVSGIARDSVQQFLFKLRRPGKKEKSAYLYREFRTNFTKVWDSLIEEFFKTVGFVPPYELMITILGRFKVMENFPQYQGFFMKLLQFIKEKEEEYSGLSSFLEFFENIEERQLYVNVSDANSVKIMTTHKAKGLEFGVVVIPFLEIDVGIGSGGTGPKKPYVVRQSEDNSLSLVQLKKKYTAYSERLRREYKEEYIRSLIDELNGLYVALTRAKYEVYLFIPEKTAGKKNIARLLVPFENYERGRKRGQATFLIGNGEQEKSSLSPFSVLPVSQYSDWIGVLKDEFIAPSQLINRANMIRGKVLHFILSCIGDLSKEDKEASLKAALEKTRLNFPYIKNTKEYISVAESLLEEKKIKPFFYIKEGTLYQEKEVVDSFGNIKRIDRLIVTSKEAWVIDYKSSKDESEDQKEQLIEYMNIVKSIHPELKPRGFLVYLDTLTVEEICGVGKPRLSSS